MTPVEIRKIESTHMRPDARFRYQGRFLACVKCGERFRQRHNGTMHYFTFKTTKAMDPLTKTEIDCKPNAIGGPYE